MNKIIKKGLELTLTSALLIGGAKSLSSLAYSQNNLGPASLISQQSPSNLLNLGNPREVYGPLAQMYQDNNDVTGEHPDNEREQPLSKNEKYFIGALIIIALGAVFIPYNKDHVPD